MTDPTAAPTPAQERQEQRDAEIVGDVVIPFVACLLDIRTAIDTFEARVGSGYTGTVEALLNGTSDAIEEFHAELHHDGLSLAAHDEWLAILRNPAKTAAWYAGHKAANPRRYENAATSGNIQWLAEHLQYRCAICGERFEKQAEAEAHIAAVHGDRA